MNAGRHVQPAHQWNIDIEQPADCQKDVCLNYCQRGACRELAQQQVPAWQRSRQQQPHDSHLAVVHHRQRRLHAVEQKDDAQETWHDVILVEDVGAIGRDDRYAEHVLKSRGEHDQPQRWPYQGRQQPAALMHELHDLAAGHRDERTAHMGCHHDASAAAQMARRFRLIIAKRVEFVGRMQKAGQGSRGHHGVAGR